MAGYISRLDRGTRQRFATEVEEMIDKCSVGEMLDIIADVLGEKADHIRASYQDGTTASHWHRASGQIERLIDNLPQVSGIVR